MIKSSYGRNLKRPECLNDSENNLIVKCSNENCTIQGNIQVFRHCKRCSAYFCNQCCHLSEKIIKLLNKRSDNYWFYPSCTKRALHADFEKGIEERCQIVFETVGKRVNKIKKIIHLPLAVSVFLPSVMKNRDTSLLETNLIN